MKLAKNPPMTPLQLAEHFLAAAVKNYALACSSLARRENPEMARRASQLREEVARLAAKVEELGGSVPGPVAETVPPEPKPRAKRKAAGSGA